MSWQEIIAERESEGGSAARKDLAKKNKKRKRQKKNTQTSQFFLVWRNCNLDAIVDPRSPSRSIAFIGLGFGCDHVRGEGEDKWPVTAD